VLATLFMCPVVTAAQKWVARHVMVEAVAESLNDIDHRFLFDNHLPKRGTFRSTDPKGFGYTVDVVTRLLGQDIGKDVLFNFGRQFHQISKIMLMSARRATPQETERLRNLLGDRPK